jgi:hypothetical protein
VIKIDRIVWCSLRDVIEEDRVVRHFVVCVSVKSPMGERGVVVWFHK